jgi:hypothetical protein
MGKQVSHALAGNFYHLAVQVVPLHINIKHRQGFTHGAFHIGNAGVVFGFVVLEGRAYFVGYLLGRKGMYAGHVSVLLGGVKIKSPATVSNLYAFQMCNCVE